MSPTWITVGVLLAGVITVVGGVLLLRLHAFLALIFGALVVGALTPTDIRERVALERAAVEIKSVDALSGVVELQADATVGESFVVLRQDSGGRFESVGSVVVDAISPGAARGRFVALTAGAAPSSSDLILRAGSEPQARRTARQSVGERVARGFGDTCAKIGILIAMAAIIGKCLLESGAADRIVRAGLSICGERGAPLAFLFSGFLLGIPVFFDTVFYLMVPLGKALYMRTKKHYLLYVLTIVAGATMAHSLVPPTPGPLFVAEQLGVDLGAMILGGCIVGLCAAGAGCVFCFFMDRRHELPLRETGDASLEQLEALTQRDTRDLPGFAISVTPIVLPVVLITAATLLKNVGDGVPASLKAFVTTMGNKNMALTAAAVIAMITLVVQTRSKLQQLAASVQSALASGGTIILITAGGGAFGGMLRDTGITTLINDLPQVSPQVTLILAFLVTTAIRTAQGSATVAMITSVAILSGLATDGELGFHPVYLALAIGCGSKPIAWMNDSGFWVIGKMSGMTEIETLKYVTPLSVIMGISGLAVVLVAVTILPLA